MRICVFCGSSAGRRPSYRAAASAFGERIADRQLGLVYGGASVGLMGAVADGARSRGGEVIGVIPEALVAHEVAHRELADLRVVDSMHARKALMAELSDAFVALPGGIGTLEELFEVWTWAQLGMHRKPCGLLDVDGYYDRLGDFLDHTVEQGFLRPEHRSLLIVERDPDVLLARLLTAPTVDLPKWIGPDES